MRCSRCKGRGSEPLNARRRRPCPRCEGDGLTCDGIDKQGDPCPRPVVAAHEGEHLCALHFARVTGGGRVRA